MDPDNTQKTNGSETNAAKISDTRNVIMNKFKKACSIRLEHERDVNQSMKPLTALPTSSSKTMIDAIEIESSEKNNEMHDNPNELCLKLKVLMQSWFAGNVEHTHEISSIIAKLRELEIIM